MLCILSVLEFGTTAFLFSASAELCRFLEGMTGRTFNRHAVPLTLDGQGGNRNEGDQGN
jgi:hypothetical protein